MMQGQTAHLALKHRFHKAELAYCATNNEVNVAQGKLCVQEMVI